MRPSLQPRKKSLQQNKEATEDVRKRHWKDNNSKNGYSKKLIYLVNILIIRPITIISAFLEKFYCVYLKYPEKIEQRKVMVLEDTTNEKRDNNPPTGDYSYALAVFGFFMGGWIGYLLRPHNIFGLQLSIQQILDLINSKDSIIFGEDPLKSMAYTSIEFIITGAILGYVVWWAVGKLIKW